MKCSIDLSSNRVYTQSMKHTDEWNALATKPWSFETKVILAVVVAIIVLGYMALK